MNLYDQLTKLQVIEKAFIEWQAYRESLTSHIMKELPNESEVALWGAGRCNDLDLGVLAKNCKSIWLIDKNEEALRNALKQYGLENNNKVKIKICDFSGIEEQVYRTYADRLVSEVRIKGLQTNVEELANRAIKILDQVSDNLKQNTIDLSAICCDYTVMIGVHSQLIMMFDWIWQVILQTLGREEERVRQRIIALNEEVVKRVNRSLWQATRKQCIIGCETGRVGRVGTVQGAIHALEHIEELVGQGDMKRKDIIYLEWPFNQSQGINYQMEIQTLEINKK